MQRLLRAVDCQRGTGIGENGVESNALASQRPREYRLSRPGFVEAGYLSQHPRFRQVNRDAWKEVDNIPNEPLLLKRCTLTISYQEVAG